VQYHLLDGHLQIQALLSYFVPTNRRLYRINGCYSLPVYKECL